MCLPNQNYVFLKNIYLLWVWQLPGILYSSARTLVQAVTFTILVSKVISHVLQKLLRKASKLDSTLPAHAHYVEVKINATISCTMHH